MAYERAPIFRNVGTEEAPIWEQWFIKTVADAVLMSETDSRNIKQYVDQKLAELVGSAPETLDTLEELAAYILAHEDVANALNAAIANKADKNHSHTDATTTASGFMSAAAMEKLTNIEAGAKVNIIESVKRNGTPLSISNKEINIEVPTKLSELTDDLDTANSSELNAVKSTAEGAASAAAAAQATANNAVSNAATAQTTANNAASAASEAQSTANSAASAAAAAQATADKKAEIYFASTLPAQAKPGAVCFLI